MTTTTQTYEKTAREVMTEDVVAVDAAMPVAELAGLLGDRGISGVLVRDHDGRPAGVVTVSDVAAAHARGGRGYETVSRADFYSRGWEAPTDDADLETMRVIEGDLTVGDVMTPHVVSVAPDAPVSDVAHRMLDLHIHRVLVREGDEVIGVVSSSDLLALVAGESS